MFSSKGRPELFLKREIPSFFFKLLGLTSNFNSKTRQICEAVGIGTIHMTTQFLLYSQSELSIPKNLDDYTRAPIEAKSIVLASIKFMD